MRRVIILQNRNFLLREFNHGRKRDKWPSLSLEHACYVEETMILMRYLKQVRSLNKAARALIKRRNGKRAAKLKIRNTWMNNGDSHSRNGSSSQGT